jgi:O-antigen/teichoic acid export membrane protein
MAWKREMSEAIELAQPQPSAEPDPSKVSSTVAPPAGSPSSDHAPHDLKRKTARGALVSTFGQGANFVLRTGSMVVLARLLTPADFGLVGMATACTGFLALVQDAGLSMATVQRATITRAQTSTLFWINLAVGVILAALCAAMAPLVVAFYHEPRLFWMMVVFGSGFLFSGAAAQHRAIMQREMRFSHLAMIDIAALCVSIAVGIAMAVAGKGYWALVGMALALPVVSLIGVWVAGGWLPGPPQRQAGVRSMLRYGGTVTLNGVIVYIAYNADKVLLGRFCGAEVLGIYGRAYQLINLPTANLNSAIGSVAIPALSRLQNDPERLKNYFLKGYSLFLSLVLPITVACALFAEDIVLVFLGPKWGAAVPVFRWLAPTILAFALINPPGWLMLATNRAGRSLLIALMIAPIVILGYFVGLSHGPEGVAAGFSVTTVLLVVPVIAWATRDTAITAIATFRVVMRPVLAILLGTAVTVMLWGFIHLLNPPILRLVVANTVLFGVYGLVLWFVLGQKVVYLSLLREIGVLRSAPGSKKDNSV